LYFLTRHASERRQQMNLDEKTIADLVYRPRVVIPEPSRRDPSHIIYKLKHGDLTALADKDRNGDWKIITILPATREAWEKYYPEERDGRYVKDDVWGAGAREVWGRR
jgi:hypothetical protein